MKFYQSDDILADIIISPFEVMLKIVVNIAVWAVSRLYRHCHQALRKLFSYVSSRLTDAFDSRKVNGIASNRFGFIELNKILDIEKI